MGVIAVLDDVLANQIAAGEVVERPASVVKELVENALDADATRVFIDVEDGGRTLIRVVDDGAGMSRDDAPRAMLSHATSKIRASADLDAIGTLGFRGEALPSIGSVSRLRLVTRRDDDTVATEVTVDCGAPAQVADAGSPVGTRVEVRDLFCNVPARLKFLKRRQTELGHINALVATFALGHPHVHFRLTSDGRTTAEHPPAPRLEQRVYQVLGKQARNRLYKIALDGPVRVSGFIAEPGFTRSSHAGLHTFVNGRRVRDRTMSHAIVAAYGTLLERGRYPYAVVYLHLNPADVDVNVHPAKAEVRFARAADVHDALLRACKLTISAAPWRHLPTLAPTPSLPLGLDSPAGRARTQQQPPRPAWGAPQPLSSPPNLPIGAQPAEPAVERTIHGVARGGHLIVVENRDGLHLIDVTRARRALAVHQLAVGERRSRPLMMPVQLELSAARGAALATHRASLHDLGFELGPFGGATWQVLALPRALAEAPADALIDAAIDTLAGLPEQLSATQAARLATRLAACLPVTTLSRDDVATTELITALEAADLAPPAQVTPAIAYSLDDDALAAHFDG